MACCSKIRTNKGQETPGDSQRGERRQASSPEHRGYIPADYFGRYQLGGYRSWDILGGAGAVPKPHAGSSDGDTAIELLSETVIWFVLVWLVWFGRQRGMKNRVCNGLDFSGAADSLGYAKGLWGSRCDCSGGPTSRNDGFSLLSSRRHRTNLRGPLRFRTWNGQVDQHLNGITISGQEVPKDLLKLLFSNFP